MDIQLQKNETYKNREYSKGVELEPRVMRVREIMNSLPADLEILDVGCADGEVLRPMSAKFKLHGLDFSDSFVEQAREIGIQAQRCDFAKEKFPHENESFDTVFTGETIEHLIDTDLFLSEINRVLRGNGLLVMTVPNVRTWLSIAMMMIGGLPPRFSARYRSPHYRDFTLRTVKLALENNGFVLEKAEGTSFYIPGVGETMKWLAKYFPSWTGQMILMARKVRTTEYDSTKAIEVNLY